MPGGDTICVRSTAAGRSHLSLVRISGPDAIQACKAIGVELPRARGVYARDMPLGGGTVSITVLVAIGPGSYTAEDTVELVLPGNPALVDRVIGSLTALEDVREAGPGEFTARAFGAGKLTLEQAEGVAMSIAAESEDQLQGARSLLEGKTGARYRDWADRITLLLALIEAGTDFADQEDVVAIEPDDLSDRANEIANEIESCTGEVREARAGVPVIAMVGAPSAGKSTLFNALLGRTRAVTDAKPGTTRDALVETIDLAPDAPGASEAQLMDLPGIDVRAAQDEASLPQAVSLVESKSNEADAVVVVDPSGRFAELVELGLEPRLDRGECVLVRTMADLPSSAGRGLPVCALDGRNMPALRRAIADAAFGSSGASGSSLIGATSRHARSLSRVTQALREAADASVMGDELVAVSLRSALDAIGEIVGRVESDDVLARVFSSFCIGK